MDPQDSNPSESPPKQSLPVSAETDKLSVMSRANPAFAVAATAYSATTQAATAFSGSSIGHPLTKQHRLPVPAASSSHQIETPPTSNLHRSITISGGGGGDGASCCSLSEGATSTGQQQQSMEKLSRPMAFDKVRGCHVHSLHFQY